MDAQLRFLAGEGVELVITSGGLGPTADDLTAEVVGRFQGRPLRLDQDLEQRIADIVAPLARRWRDVDPEAMRLGTRKQAMVPEGAAVLEPAGTAPGLVVAPSNGTGPTVVVLPGPPRELHEMWPAAKRSDPFAAAIGGRTLYEQRMLRMFGIPESEIAETLRVAEGEVPDMERLEITTCLRRGEVEVVTRYEPGVGEQAWRGLEDVVRRRHSDTLFSTDGSSVDDQVAELLAGRRLAVAESCTGGLMAARLTERPGSSDYVVGGVVSYADEVKTELVGVDPGLIERHGAVSVEVAEAMAEGALARFEADVAVAITGVAGPGGGSEEKPVGTVCWSVRSAESAALTRQVRLPGDRADVRDRSTTVGMHLLRRLLRGEDAPL
jgi:nicotinamide-nucleotide amidase